MVADGVGGTGLTAERSDTLTANVRMVYDNNALVVTSRLDTNNADAQAILNEIENQNSDVPDLNEVSGVAAGFILGLQQELLANA